MLFTAQVTTAGGTATATLEVGRGTSRFPTTDTTGVPAGTSLVPLGSVTVAQPGAVLEGLNIRGVVKIAAPGVVIRNSAIVTSTTKYPIEMLAGGSVVVEDSEIDGLGQASCAVLGGNYTLRRVEIRNVKDGPRIEGDNVLLDACLIHKLTRVEGGHHDCVQMRSGRNATVRGCTLQAWREDTRDPMNACIQFGSWTGEVPTNVLVEGNWMDGGNRTINGGFPGLTVRGNTFGENYKYGFMGSLGGAVWEGNVREDGSPAEPAPFAAPLAA